jgi:hypothetical protein
VLHPRHKLLYFKGAGWEDDWIMMVQKIVHDKFEQSYADLDSVEILEKDPGLYMVCILALSS